MLDLDKEKSLILITLCFDVLFVIMGIVAWYFTKNTKFFGLSGLYIIGSLSFCSLMISTQN